MFFGVKSKAVCKRPDQKMCNTMIVQSTKPVTLLGGGPLNESDLTKSLEFAPRVIAADGGIRHLGPDHPLPDAIVGDLDSIENTDLKRFSDRIHRIEDQNTTDFEKVLTSVSAPLYLALGFLGGRLDHSFAALNLLARFTRHRVVAFGAEDIVALVPQRIQLNIGAGTPLALLPMGESKVTTTGLVWDLDSAFLRPDGAISSSNQAAEDRVEVTTDGPVLLSLPKSQLHALIAALHGQ